MEKVINNYKDFLDELELNNKKIKVTEEFFKWLDSNIGFSCTRTDGKNKIGFFHGAEVIMVKENKDDRTC